MTDTYDAKKHPLARVWINGKALLEKTDDVSDNKTGVDDEKVISELRAFLGKLLSVDNTSREASILQGFPAYYDFLPHTNSVHAIARMIGNAFPPSIPASS